MVLLFKFDANDPLEHIFASGRYQRYWQANGEYIVASLHRHTGLRFIQRKITVKIKEGSVSQAGNENKPMRLSVENKTDSELACTLIHELAHRLVMGNGIVPSDKNEHAKSRAPYHMHDTFIFSCTTYL